MNFKQLRPGELRFIAKSWDKKLWGIYDKARGSWPERGPELGEVPQKLESKTEAESIAERLNAEHPVQEAAVTTKKQRGKKTEKSSTPEPAKKTEPVEPMLEEVVGYDDIDEEAAKKYTEGLF